MACQHPGREKCRARLDRARRRRQGGSGCLRCTRRPPPGERGQCHVQVGTAASPTTWPRTPTRTALTISSSITIPISSGATPPCLTQLPEEQPPRGNVRSLPPVHRSNSTPQPTSAGRSHHAAARGQIQTQPPSGRHGCRPNGSRSGRTCTPSSECSEPTLRKLLRLDIATQPT